VPFRERSRVVPIFVIGETEVDALEDSGASQCGPCKAPDNVAASDFGAWCQICCRYSPLEVDSDEGDVTLRLKFKRRNQC